MSVSDVSRSLPLALTFSLPFKDDRPVCDGLENKLPSVPEQKQHVGL